MAATLINKKVINSVNVNHSRLPWPNIPLPISTPESKISSFQISCLKWIIKLRKCPLQVSFYVIQTSRFSKGDFDACRLGGMVVLFILSQKLKEVEIELIQWNRDVFGNVHSKGAAALNKIDQVQQNIDKIGSIQNLLDAEDLLFWN